MPAVQWHCFGVIAASHDALHGFEYNMKLRALCIHEAGTYVTSTVGTEGVGTSRYRSLEVNC